LQDHPKGASSKWLSKAREYAHQLKEMHLERKMKLKDLLGDLEDEIALVESSLGEKGQE
jgi:hypothetical protein